MSRAKNIKYCSILSICILSSAFSLRGGQFKEALERQGDLDLLRTMAVSKSQALNDKRSSETDPNRLESIKKKIILSALRIQKIDEIKTLLGQESLQSPLEEHYVMLKTLQVPSQIKPEEVAETDINTAPPTSHVIVPVEEDKEDWDSLNRTASGRLKLRHEALAMIEEDQVLGRLSQANPSQKFGGLFSGLENASGMSTAIANLKQVIDREDWDNEYNWSVRGWAKKHNLRLIELVKDKLNGPVREKYSK